MKPNYFFKCLLILMLMDSKKQNSHNKSSAHKSVPLRSPSTAAFLRCLIFVGLKTQDTVTLHSWPRRFCRKH